METKMMVKVDYSSITIMLIEMEASNRTETH